MDGWDGHRNLMADGPDLGQSKHQNETGSIIKDFKGLGFRV